MSHFHRKHHRPKGPMHRERARIDDLAIAIDKLEEVLRLDQEARNRAGNPGSLEQPYPTARGERM